MCTLCTAELSFSLGTPVCLIQPPPPPPEVFFGRGNRTPLELGDLPKKLSAHGRLAWAGAATIH